MLATLAQSDHAIQKSAQVYKMNLMEQENYENLNKTIGLYLANIHIVTMCIFNICSLTVYSIVAVSDKLKFLTSWAKYVIYV